MTTSSQRPWIDLARALWREIQRHNLIDGAAVLAFYFLLAVFPAAIFVLSLLPYLAIPHLQQAILDLLRQVLPQQSANLFEATIRLVSADGRNGLLTFGLIFALWSGSSGVYAILEQLNAIWDVTDRRPFWQSRGIAILLMIFFAALTIGSLSLVIFAGAVQSWLVSIIGRTWLLLLFFATLRWIILAAALLLALAVAYWLGPEGKSGFRFISPGNVSAVILTALASIGFQLYVLKFGNYDATYGNLASMIVLMLWMYMAGIALLVGAAINKILHHPKPRPLA